MRVALLTVGIVFCQNRECLQLVVEGKRADIEKKEGE